MGIESVNKHIPPNPANKYIIILVGQLQKGHWKHPSLIYRTTKPRPHRDTEVEFRLSPPGEQPS